MTRFHGSTAVTILEATTDTARRHYTDRLELTPPRRNGERFTKNRVAPTGKEPRK